MENRELSHLGTEIIFKYGSLSYVALIYKVSLNVKL